MEGHETHIRIDEPGIERRRLMLFKEEITEKRRTDSRFKNHYFQGILFG